MTSNPVLVALFSCAVLSAPALAQEAVPSGDPQEVTIENGVFSVTFSSDDGVPVRWSVIDTTGGNAGEPETEHFLDPDYVALSEFRPFGLSMNGGSLRRSYQLESGQQGDTFSVRCVSGADENGLAISKTWAFEKGSNLVSLRIDLTNEGQSPIEIDDEGEGLGISVGPGLGYAPDRAPVPPPEVFWAWYVLPFYATAQEVISVDVPMEDPFVARPEIGVDVVWGGLHSDYYVIAVVPSADFLTAQVRLDRSDAIADQIAEDDRGYYPYITFAHDPTTIAPGSSASYTYAIYAGSKDPGLLTGTERGLERVLFHHLPSWLSWLSKGLYSILGFLNGFLNSWGLSIIVFAVLFRGLTLPLSIYGTKNQMLMKAKMAELKPQIAELKQKFAKDGDARNEAILALYKEHGVNPFSHFKGCLPLMIQLPVLIALFQLLLNSNDLRGVSFLWISDLTLTDRLFPLGFTIPWLGSYFNLLPIVMFVAMVIVGRSMASAGGTTKTSAGAIYGMPIAMTLLFYPFPSGCMLFWTTGNVLQIFEQKMSVAYVQKHAAASA